MPDRSLTAPKVRPCSLSHAGRRESLDPVVPKLSDVHRATRINGDATRIRELAHSLTGAYPGRTELRQGPTLGGKHLHAAIRVFGHPDPPGRIDCDPVGIAEFPGEGSLPSPLRHRCAGPGDALDPVVAPVCNHQGPRWLYCDTYGPIELAWSSATPAICRTPRRDGIAACPERLHPVIPVLTDVHASR